MAASLVRRQLATQIVHASYQLQTASLARRADSDLVQQFVLVLLGQAVSVFDSLGSEQPLELWMLAIS